MGVRRAFLQDEQTVLVTLLSIRLINALTVRTFFQPDEYYQALEPAWNFVPGLDGAWITWEWHQALRSSVHPVIIGFAYQAATAIASFLSDTHLRDGVLLFAPKVVSVIIAALGDYYTWKLSLKVYSNSQLATTALSLTILNPWQWFCSTRTFSNSLESTITVAALYYWPFEWNADTKLVENGPKTSHVTTPAGLRMALALAAFATVIRPTNILIWIPLVVMILVETPALSQDATTGSEKMKKPAISSWSLRLLHLVREASICGPSVLLVSAVIDRAFYGIWTIPALNFLYFNVVQSLAIFYGNNDWHYYLSQGYPLLLTTLLPFAIVGLYRILFRSSSIQHLLPRTRNALKQLAIICILLPAALSVLTHKEVRFIYPVLGPLHVIAAAPVSNFFEPVFKASGQVSQMTSSTKLVRGLVFCFLLGLNILIGAYTAIVHNSGLIALPEYLRQEFSTYYTTTAITLEQPNPQNMTLAILMPCHSLPWRSHLLYPPTANAPGIQAWALTCEPPLHITDAVSKKSYFDEADIFYASPTKWLRKNMSRRPPWIFGGLTEHTRHREPGVYVAPDVNDIRNKRIASSSSNHGDRPAGLDMTDLLPILRTAPGKPSAVERGAVDDPMLRRRPWPHYLAFFAQLEPTMRHALHGSGYVECWRVFNSHWHDDWRRTGDVVVWCLFPDRARTAAATAAPMRQKSSASSPARSTLDADKGHHNSEIRQHQETENESDEEISSATEQEESGRGDSVVRDRPGVQQVVWV